jgi:HD superfamily phosphohydrolase
MADLIHRDEIHGDIRYDPLAVALLDTPALQRLGRVYQLGYGHLVYRGGTHTRLSHAMGTYHTASRLVAALRKNYEGATARPNGAIAPEEFLPRRPSANPTADENQLSDRWAVLRHLVAWAAALHDVGHIPLGHTLEDEFDGIFEKHDDFASPRLRHLWLSPDSEIGQVLRRTDLYPQAFGRLGLTDGDAVAAAVLLISMWKEKVDKGQRTTFQEILADHMDRAGRAGQGIAPDLLAAMEAVCPALFSPYMADIVANTISADYLDYLRRDPHNLGLDVLRDDRVVLRFWVGLDHQGQSRMALALVDRRGKPRLDTCTGVIELVRQRYRFAEIVYYHRTKVAASAMLAKVFHLVGAPPEIPPVRTRLTVSDARQRADQVFDAPDGRRRSELNKLIKQCKPTALLDPEIGDEGLGALMRDRAVDQLEEALKAGRADPHRESEARKSAADAVRSVALLDQLARRELYKTAFTMDSEQFPKLGGFRDTPQGDRERELAALIGRLRKDGGARAITEGEMEAAADWAEGSILLYVPGRKVQAKGIETGALADGKVVTLGDHPAVRGQVDELGRRYAALWRLIVLVHPDHANDAVGLSEAIDAFVRRHFPGRDLDDHGIMDVLDDCCWFAYHGRADRPAARRYLQLAGQEDGRGDLEYFQTYRRDSERCSADALAFGAALVERVARTRGDGAALTLVQGMGNPAEVEARVRERAGLEVASASRQGELDADPETRGLQHALQQLADELTNDGHNT